MGIRQTLRPYQVEVGRAVLDSVLNWRGHTFTVEVARQGGKNELSAQLEVLLLTLHMLRGANLVKAAPTYVPQLLISMRRLEERLADAGLGPLCVREEGHALRVGKARQVFLSAEPTANVVGATAHFLEIDEAQDVEREVFWRAFRPMGASTNATTVLYGTPWDGESLLEQVREANLEAERRDGVKRHFAYDWREVAQHNPLYLRYVEAERQRLGEEHPLFRTQYLLLPLPGQGGLFSLAQRAQLQGHHPRLQGPKPGRTYVAGIDIAGQGEEAESSGSYVPRPRQDSTVVTVGELDFSECDETRPEPTVRIVQHYAWRGVPHHQLFPQLVDLLRSVWRCRRVAVDATGLGAGVASFLEKALGRSVVEAVTFTAQSKSRLGYDLIAAVNTGRLKMYAADGTPEGQEFWRQVCHARAHYRANQTMSFYVDPSEGHDDYLSSMALLVEAARYLPRVARGRAPAGLSAITA
ncbi:MAG: hypothetical protein Q8O40_09475 [Chloroflexota bacterium]|nr:hypothetical protein [Chloroflexota bacterium]